MVSYVFLSFFLAVLGIAAVVTVTTIVLRRVRRERELARRKRELSSENELDELLRQVDQATGAEDLDRLDEERGNG